MNQMAGDAFTFNPFSGRKVEFVAWWSMVDGRVIYTSVLQVGDRTTAGPTGDFEVLPGRAPALVVMSRLREFIGSRPITFKGPDDPLWALKHALPGGRF